MDSIKPHFEEFIAEYPEHAAGRETVTLEDGRSEDVIQIDTLEAFLRWCLIEGYGDGQKIVAFLAEAIPGLNAYFEARDAGQNAPDSTAGRREE